MVNIKELVNKQSKLTAKKASSRARRLELTSKTIRGKARLHIIPDTNDMVLLTTKQVYEVHQTEKYTYNGEEKTRRPTYIIPSPQNYSLVDGAVTPTEMQLSKLNKLISLISEYADITNPYQKGGAKLDAKTTETQLWVKYHGFYTKFWAKVASIEAVSPDPKYTPDLSKVMIVSNSSAKFVSSFNTWATPDVESELSVEDQYAKIEAALTKEKGTNLRCISVNTTKADIGFDVEVKNVKPDVASVDITDEDLEEITPLIEDDWNYKVFDDEKVDTLIQRLEKYLAMYTPSETEDEDEDSESEEDETESTDEDESAIESGESETKGNPFTEDE